MFGPQVVVQAIYSYVMSDNSHSYKLTSAADITDIVVILLLYVFPRVRSSQDNLSSQSFGASEIGCWPERQKSERERTETEGSLFSVFFGFYSLFIFPETYMIVQLNFALYV